MTLIKLRVSSHNDIPAKKFCNESCYKTPLELLITLFSPKYCVLVVSCRKEIEQRKNPARSADQRKASTEVARGNEVFNLRRRSNMSTTTKTARNVEFGGKYSPGPSSSHFIPCSNMCPTTASYARILRVALLVPLKLP